MRFARIIIATLGVAAALAFSACGGDKPKPAVAFPDSLVDDETIVTLNGTPVTARDLKVFTLVYQPQSRDSLNNRMFNLELLNGYIDRMLLWQEAKAVGVTVDDSTQSWFVNAFVRSMGGEERVRGFLATMGIDQGELAATIRRDLMVRIFVEKRLGAGVSVTEADVRAYYDNNPQRFVSEDSVRARHIVVLFDSTDSESVQKSKLRHIEIARERLGNGEDFAALASSISEGPSATRGGDLGFFSRHDMVKDFTDVAFSLKPGQTSGIVRTRFGYHIIKVEAFKPSRKIPYEEVHDLLLDGLEQRALGAELENHLKRNRAVAIIEPNFDYGGLTQRESTTFTR